MYELKKNGKVFMSKFVRTVTSSCEKNLQDRVLTEVEKHWSGRLPAFGETYFFPLQREMPKEPKAVVTQTATT